MTSEKDDWAAIFDWAEVRREPRALERRRADMQRLQDRLSRHERDAQRLADDMARRRRR